MLALALAASLASPEPPASFHASTIAATAEVTVQIVDAATVSLGHPASDRRAQFRNATVRVDGLVQPARLVEFQ